ncbi:MAG TPA: TIGR03557 family F420-dependent LLM class oxidoreductase [Polyangiales bacterium]|nr:TIGR03557 family F420-dependent LLM class oxidoreductase [Polyangiales bacterium]
MPSYGYKLMSEEHGPSDLVRNATRAEEAGFDFVAISDHFHPWLTSQGHSPAAWTVLGAIAARTQRVGLVTAVTCPTIRYHPATVAQSAATLAILSGGRFTLGLGAGENLNEHVVGHGWPAPHERQDMLFEAVDIIEALWEGNEVSHDGAYFHVDRAKLFDVPKQPPRIAVAAGGPRAARLAGEEGLALFATEPKAELVQHWSEGGGKGPRYAEVGLCWARSEAEAVRIARERMSFSLLGWKVMAELPTWESFEAAASIVHDEDVAKQVACGPDPEKHVAAVRKYVEAGFDHIVLLGAGPDQDGFLSFWQKELKPRLTKL